MGNSELDTSLLDNAIRFAVQAHAGTERRGKGFPYIVHPLEAMAIVATMTSDQELLAAAALHDILEDTDLTVEDLRKTFGDRIARIVEEESDTEFPGTHAADSWHDRKRIAMQHLRTASPEAKIVALGDKRSNMRAIARDYALQGDSLWNLFHVKDKESHAWHYRGLMDALSSLDGTAAYDEFKRLVLQVFTDE